MIGIDKDTDLAVLKLTSGADKETERRQFDYLDFANSDKVQVGQWAMGLGAPFNLEYSLTLGIVSQKGRYNIHLHKYGRIHTDRRFDQPWEQRGAFA